MLQYRATDILLELIELTHERIDEVRCQVAYYRVSVYKGETAEQITTKLGQIERVSKIFGDDHLVDAFSDYVALEDANGQLCAPGECSFTRRVTTLLHAVELHLARLYRGLMTHSFTRDAAVLADALKEARHDVLALCHTGSRQWSFFQSFE
ncbi:MAG: hypothetical protein FJ146_06285 [Deltaproteobacteria bacterium]|nr:hypothetical protein [Deltaproteobacteria bacterium]